MASINKKDLRALKPGELLVSRRQMSLWLGDNDALDLKTGTFTSRDFDPLIALISTPPVLEPVLIPSGEVLLTLKDFRFIPVVVKNTGWVVKVLWGERIAWLYEPTSKQVSSFIKVIRKS